MPKTIKIKTTIFYSVTGFLMLVFSFTAVAVPGKIYCPVNLNCTGKNLDSCADIDGDPGSSNFQFSTYGGELKKVPFAPVEHFSQIEQANGKVSKTKKISGFTYAGAVKKGVYKLNGYYVPAGTSPGDPAPLRCRYCLQDDSDCGPVVKQVNGEDRLVLTRANNFVVYYSEVIAGSYAATAGESWLTQPSSETSYTNPAYGLMKQFNFRYWSPSLVAIRGPTSVKPASMSTLDEVGGISSVVIAGAMVIGGTLKAYQGGYLTGWFKLGKSSTSLENIDSSSNLDVNADGEFEGSAASTTDDGALSEEVVENILTGDM